MLTEHLATLAGESIRTVRPDDRVGALDHTLRVLEEASNLARGLRRPTGEAAINRPQAPAVAYVPLERLRTHPDNVHRDLGDLRELVESIRQQGVLLPLRVEHRPGSEVLRIRAGHRRAAAAELAGLPKVPCVVVAALSPVSIQSCSPSACSWATASVDWGLTVSATTTSAPAATSTATNIGVRPCRAAALASAAKAATSTAAEVISARLPTSTRRPATRPRCRVRGSRRTPPPAGA